MVDRALALLHGSLDTPVFGEAFHALGVDLLGLGVEFGLVLGIFRSEGRPLRLEARELLAKRHLLDREPALPPFRRGDALLLFGNAPAAPFQLLHEVLLDLALRALRGLGKSCQLPVIGLPAVRAEQALRLLDLALLRQRPNVGDHGADLTGRANFCRTLALLG